MDGGAQTAWADTLPLPILPLPRFFLALAAGAFGVSEAPTPRSAPSAARRGANRRWQTRARTDRTSRGPWFHPPARTQRFVVSQFRWRNRGSKVLGCVMTADIQEDAGGGSLSAPGVSSLPPYRFVRCPDCALADRRSATAASPHSATQTGVSQHVDVMQANPSSQSAETVQDSKPVQDGGRAPQKHAPPSAVDNARQPSPQETKVEHES